MTLPIKLPYPPMDALSVDAVPEGPEWQYEPKWDGFRCLAVRDGARIQLQSKAGQPLARYFPEVVEALRELGARRFVLDGEIVVPIGDKLSFDELLMRIHPAESRVRKLAAEHPAMLIVFDLLVDPRGTSLVERPLRDRRQRLEAFAKKFLDGEQINLSPATRDVKVARKWFRSAGASLDGVIAKRLDMPYQSGERTGMQKVKPVHSVDCVVGGFRYASGSKKLVGSLLLGLYDDDGLLHHVGFTSSFSAAEREKLTAKLKKLVRPPGFTGRAPGGPSRWSTKRSSEWQPLAPKLLVEVTYDHFTGGRFRHGTKFLRWRPDRAPRQCTMDQVAGRGSASLRLLEPVAG